MQSIRKVHQRKLFEMVAQQLREAIVGGQLRPGQKLLETELAAQFGVSRGPIREALRELVREGLVAELPRRGTLVSAVTLGDLIEVYDVREALETFAVTLAIAKATKADLTRLGRALSAMERAWHDTSTAHHDAMSADMHFHRVIFELAENVRMLGLVDQMTAQTAYLLRVAYDTNPSLRLAPGDEVHRSILEAISARDVAAAQAAVAAHYQYTRERLFTFIDESAGQGAPLRATASGRRPD